MIWPCGRDNSRNFSCILFKFVIHATNKQFSDKFDNAWKNGGGLLSSVLLLTIMSEMWDEDCNNLMLFQVRR